MHSEARDIEAADAFFEAGHPENDNAHAGPTDAEALHWLLDCLIELPFVTSCALWASQVESGEAALWDWVAQNPGRANVRYSTAADALFVSRPKETAVILTFYRGVLP